MPITKPVKLRYGLSAMLDILGFEILLGIDEMRYFRLFIVVPIVVSFLVSACGIGSTSPITPASDNITFLFFRYIIKVESKEG